MKLRLVLAAVGAMVVAVLLTKSRLNDPARTPQRADPTPVQESLIERSQPSADGPALADAPRRDLLDPTELTLAAGEGGICGRIVFPDGRSCSQTRLEWVELDPGRLLASAEASGNTERPEGILDSGRSGGDGRFVLKGSPRRAHALVVDRGGRLFAIKPIEAVLVPGQVVDVGDVQVGGGERVCGRVIDESGVPLPDVSVRAALLPEWWTDYRLEALRSNILVALYDRSVRGVVEIPGALALWLDSPPLPTSLTSADGVFCLDGMPPPPFHVVLSRPGWLARAELVFVVPDQGEVLEFALSRGEEFTGVVREADGSPAPGAEIRAGSASPRGGLTVLPGAATADEQGAFRLSGLAPDSAVLLAFRPASSPVWQLVGPVDVRHLELKLDPALGLEVVVADEDGNPVDAEAELRPKPIEVDHPFLAVLADAVQPGAVELRRLDDGRFRVESIRAGRYELSVRAEGFVEELIDLDLEESRTASVHLLRGAPHALHVTGPDGEAVGGATVRVFRANAFAGRSDAVTDSQGRAPLGALHKGQEVRVRVTHPGFASTVVSLSGEDVARTRVHEVRMREWGTLEGRVTSTGPLPSSLAVAVDECSTPVEIMDELRLRWCAVDSGGSFRVENLEPGRHAYRVVVSIPGMSGLLERLVPSGDSVLATGRVEIPEGETVRVTIEIASEEEREIGSIMGIVRTNGSPVAGVSIVAAGQGWSRSSRTDAHGAFRMQSVPAGMVALEFFRVFEGQRLPMATRLIDLATAEFEIVDVDLHPVTCVIEAVDPVSGKAVTGVQVGIWSDTGYSFSTMTRSTGTATVHLPEPGEYHVEVSTNDHEPSELSFKIDSSEDGKVVVATLGSPRR